ncbi:MAG: hypothetical protein Q8830_03480, partial [Candidatus Phytoplasma australasiaticum]|nr:hypothetical protein [Candidatus Phytoplasma australasiaticum]
NEDNLEEFLGKIIYYDLLTEKKPQIGVVNGCVHSTFPRPHLWDSNGYDVVVVLPPWLGKDYFPLVDPKPRYCL